MSSRHASTARSEGGTASVELVAAVPFLLLTLLVAAQVAAAGYALWSAAIAARAGARAALVGGNPDRVARRALPVPLREGAEVNGSGPVDVAVAVPRLLPLFPPISVKAKTGLEPSGGR